MDATDDMEVQFDDLLGLPLDTKCELTDPEPESSSAAAPAATTISVQELEADALRNNPTIASARATFLKARAGSVLRMQSSFQM